MLRLRYWRKIILMNKNRLTKIAYKEEIKKSKTEIMGNTDKRNIKEIQIKKVLEKSNATNKRRNMEQNSRENY